MSLLVGRKVNKTHPQLPFFLPCLKYFYYPRVYNIKP